MYKMYKNKEYGELVVSLIHVHSVRKRETIPLVSGP